MLHFYSSFDRDIDYLLTYGDSNKCFRCSRLAVLRFDDVNYCESHACDSDLHIRRAKIQKCKLCNNNSLWMVKYEHCSKGCLSEVQRVDSLCIFHVSKMTWCEPCSMFYYCS
jgi:hypothetical protein